MPDATRPTRSMFWKATVSFLSFDGSLRRITSHPGGKNLNIIFAYTTSLAYDRAMHNKGPKNVTGIDVFKEFQNEWITPRLWLEEIGWGGPDGQVTPYAEKTVSLLFTSFMQDGVLKSRGEYPDLEYQFIQELDYPTQEQIEQARNSNKYFILAMEDLINLLPKTLEHGRSQASRTTSSWLPLWEAVLGDPLVDIFREEMLVQAQSNLPSVRKDQKELHILEIGTGTGIATVKFIPMLIEKYSNISVHIHCFEEVSNLLKRAQERISAFDNEQKDIYSAKGLEFFYHYTTKKYIDPITLPEDSVDLILSFQNLHYLSQGDRYNHIENLSKLLAENGVVIVAQTTSYSDEFPHPMTLGYMTVEGFDSYPTVDNMKEISHAFFKSTKSSAIDSMWVLKKPKF